MAKVKTQYVCQNCGYISPRYLGRCPNCNEWNTLVEETVAPKAASLSAPSLRRNGIHDNKPEPIDKVAFHRENRFKTSMEELNRVLGGGVVPGSLILIGGDPGIGKSTLMLQVSGQLSKAGKILYVSGEESASQIKMRATRLGVNGDQLYVYPETDMDVIKSTISELKPDAVVIDSVQTMQIPELQSATGSVAQIREVTADLMNIAKGQGITVFVVGHVTKGGAIAGPKILEHMVDTVLYFEGDLHHSYRILRTVKKSFWVD
ncbi:ATPase domain-containing protein [Lentilactobacillus kisonensis]|uniref:ATPase domain-containing protein n=1 Tax=Lentilactobacillus kisonensis TaxID=481722 RepID=UPI000A979E8B